MLNQMKSFLFSLVLLTTVQLVEAQKAAPGVTAATEILQLKENSYDFGTIPQGRPVTHKFTVVNTGKESVRIENVLTSCGCTTPEWSRDPIAPGGSSTIIVGYNAAADGPFSKTVSVVYDTNKQASIVISGTVHKAPATPAPVNASISLLKQSNQ